MSTTKNVFKLADHYDFVKSGNITYNGEFQALVLGKGSVGVLGLNNLITRSSPTQLPGSWCRFGAQVDQFSINFGIKTDNTLWVWGIDNNDPPNGNAGMLGLNEGPATYIAKSSPVQIPGTNWCDVAASKSLAFGIKTNNTLWAWGTGFRGVGNGTNSYYSSPVQIAGSAWCCVVGNGRYTQGVFKTDGSLWTWGLNDTGGIGDNSTTNKNSPVQIPGNWCCVVGRMEGFHGIKTDNTLWAWGNNRFGGLGLNRSGNNEHRSSPTQIPGSNWCEISGNYDGMRAIKTDGTLWIWGCTCKVHVDNPSLNFTSSPTQVPGTSWCKFLSDGQPQTSISVTKSDGTLWVWGDNGEGRLGINDIISRSSPIQLPGSGWSCSFMGAAASGNRLIKIL